jgi:hypothetical protein
MATPNYLTMIRVREELSQAIEKMRTRTGLEPGRFGILKGTILTACETSFRSGYREGYNAKEVEIGRSPQKGIDLGTELEYYSMEELLREIETRVEISPRRPHGESSGTHLRLESARRKEAEAKKRRDEKKREDLLKEIEGLLLVSEKLIARVEKEKVVII